MATPTQKKLAQKRLKAYRRWIRWPNWTGFAERTIWDWMQLLLIPIALAALVSLFNIEQEQMSIANSARQAALQQQVALDQQQDTLLQNYLDKMSDLITVDHLKDPKLGIDARSVARARTLVTLLGLNNPVPGFKNEERKGMVLRFLYEEDLISGTQPIINLTIADFSLTQLEGANLQGINLNGANLRGADLSGTNLSEANLNGADLKGAMLKGTHLNHAMIENAILDKATLTEADLSYADLRHASLDAASVDSAILNYTHLDQANLYKAILTTADLSHVYLIGANVGSADLSYAVLEQAELGHADFDHAVLTNVNFSYADLNHADLSYAKNLQSANWFKANLTDADVSGTNVTKQFLKKSAKSIQGLIKN